MYKTTPGRPPLRVFVRYPCAQVMTKKAREDVGLSLSLSRLRLTAN